MSLVYLSRAYLVRWAQTELGRKDAQFTSTELLLQWWDEEEEKSLRQSGE